MITNLVVLFHLVYVNAMKYLKFICYPACLSTKLYIDIIPVCDNEDNPVSKSSKSSKSMMILWIVLPILFVLLLAASIYLYYRYRYCCLSSDSPDRSSQYVDINQNNNIMDENNDHNHDVNNQVLELVVIGELVSTVAGAVATDNEILNLPSEEDILFVDLFVDGSELITIDVVNDTRM